MKELKAAEPSVKQFEMKRHAVLLMTHRRITRKTLFTRFRSI